MAKLSISAAAKLAGVSRSTLYRSYIDKGLLSVSKDQKSKPCIDTSELLRVFGVLQGGTVRDSTSDSVRQVEKHPKTHQSALALELKLVKEQLEESREREGWYKKKIDDLTDTMKRLEGPKTRRRWWPFWK